MIRIGAGERQWKELSRRVLPAEAAELLEDALNGDLTRQMELFGRMEDTWPHLVKALNEVRRAVSRIPFTVTPYKEKDAEPTSTAQEKARLVERAIWSMRPRVARMENDLEGTVYDMTDALAKGVSVLEIYWHQTKDGILPRATKHIPANFYGFPQKDSEDDRLMLNVAGMRATRDGGLTDFPDNKFILGLCPNRSGHPTETALLRPLVHLWVMRCFSEKWLANYAEIFGMPIRWATYDPNNKRLLDDICSMLENLGSAGWGAFPTGTTLELKEPSKGAGDNPQAYIQEIADRACDILILGQTLTTDVGASGSRALGETHNSVRFDVLKGAADWTCRQLTRQLSDAIVAVNYGESEEVPVIAHGLKEPKDEKALVERDKILFVDMKLPVEKSYLYERHGVPVPDPSSKEDALFAPPAPPPTVLPGDQLGGGPAAQGKKGVSVQGTGKIAGNDQGKVRASSTTSPATDSTVLVQARRRAAASRLGDAVAERLSGVSASWLSPVRPVFSELLAKAMDSKVSDADFISAVSAAAKAMPELFDKLNTSALADAMEAAMGASAVNGAIEAETDRQEAEA
jgi:phage gp29-like protein